MNGAEFESYHQRWDRRIARLARRIADGDQDLADDLAQEGLWKLAALDLERECRNEEGYIWRAIRNHMLNMYRQELRARVIAPLAKRRWSSKRSGVRYVARRGTGRRSAPTSEPRHWDAAPVDDDALDPLWGDM